MKPRWSFRRLIRSLCGFIALAFGLLALAGGLLGPGPLKIWSSGESYYQITLEPSPYWALWTATGIALALVLLGIDFFERGRR